MVAIGRGLACAPRLLMLDEPSMGLAPAVADTIFERVSQIHREDGVTILLVEQRVAEALGTVRPRLCAGNRAHGAGRAVRDAAARRPGPEILSGTGLRWAGACGPAENGW